jgi:large exoprotein involved in heme utilization and adhesion
VNIQANNVTFTNAPTVQNVAIDAGLATNSGVQTRPAGDINIDATGSVNFDNAIVKNTMRSGNVGQIGDVKITANTVNLTNGAFISTNIAGRGSGGKIQVTTTGDINISGSTPQSTGSSNRESFILSSLDGQGDLGKISIDTQNRGKLILTNNGNIGSGNFSGSSGKSSDISISATAIDLSNGSAIFSSNFGGTGNAGNVAIVTTGDINISGGLPGATGLITPASNLSYISSDSFGLGDPGKVTISTQNVGKLSLANFANISSNINTNASGNSQGIKIVAREVELKNGSTIASFNMGGTGNAGDIEVKTVGDVSIYSYSNNLVSSAISDANLSFISSITQGRGNTGKITIDTSNIGKLSLINRAGINNSIGQTAIGNGNDITISARAIDIENGSSIDAGNIGGFGNAGNIRITTTGDIRIVGFNSFDPNSNKISYISSNTIGTGDAGAISIDTQNRGKVSLINDGFISSGQSATAVGDSKGISISASAIDLQNSRILSNNAGGKGKAGNIDLQTTGSIELSGKSGIASTNGGVGTTGNIAISSNSIVLNDSIIQALSKEGSGGNIRVNSSDRLVLRNSSRIFTDSIGTNTKSNGGNIAISSPLIIALPGDNDISANAFGGGDGGNINIFSQGLLGIEYRPTGTMFSDITASSTFGRSGAVSIDTPGIDPGKDRVELPNVPTDASTQIDRSCSPSNRANKFAVTGRGGLPPNAGDPLTQDVVWQDSGSVSSQPGVATAIANPAPPAVSWVFDGKGNVTLIASGSSGQMPGTGASCPQPIGK